MISVIRSSDRPASSASLKTARSIMSYLLAIAITGLSMALLAIKKA